jgi:hypothetical protein
MLCVHLYTPSEAALLPQTMMEVGCLVLKGCTLSCCVANASL